MLTAVWLIDKVQTYSGVSTNMLADLNYEQRLLLGKITARTQFSQEARKNAMRQAQAGQIAESFFSHQQADQHDHAIISAIFEIVEIHKNCTGAEVVTAPLFGRPVLQKTA